MSSADAQTFSRRCIRSINRSVSWVTDLHVSFISTRIVPGVDSKDKSDIRKRKNSGADFEELSKKIETEITPQIQASLAAMERESRARTGKEFAEAILKESNAREQEEDENRFNEMVEFFAALFADQVLLHAPGRQDKNAEWHRLQAERQMRYQEKISSWKDYVLAHSGSFFTSLTRKTRQTEKTGENPIDKKIEQRLTDLRNETYQREQQQNNRRDDSAKRAERKKEPASSPPKD